VQTEEELVALKKTQELYSRGRWLGDYPCYHWEHLIGKGSFNIKATPLETLSRNNYCLKTLVKLDQEYIKSLGVVIKSHMMKYQVPRIKRLTDKLAQALEVVQKMESTAYKQKKTDEYVVLEDIKKKIEDAYISASNMRSTKC
jgi:hypothetical protein